MTSLLYLFWHIATGFVCISVVTTAFFSANQKASVVKPTFVIKAVARATLVHFHIAILTGSFLLYTDVILKGYTLLRGSHLSLNEVLMQAVTVVCGHSKVICQSLM